MNPIRRWQCAATPRFRAPRPEVHLQQIHDRGAVIIGGGSGIGRGTALGLADAGARLVVADIDLYTAARVADELRAKGASAVPTRVDATDRSSLAELATFCLRELGAVQILSNNVGVHQNRRLDGCDENDWAWAFELNFMSIVRAVDAFLPLLRAQGGEAHIVNTASMAAVVAQGIDTVPAYLGVYTATKHAVLGYTEILRSELAEEGIGVSVLCPGMVLSNLAATSARHRPARFGGPLPDPAKLSDAVRAMAMSQDAIGPIVVRGILANRLHIFSHPERRVQVEARHRRMLDDFDFAAGEGD